MSVVKLLIIRARSAAKIWALVFLAVRRRYHCTSASNWDSKAWKFSHTERKSYACALRYVPAKFYYSNSRPHKCRTRNYVSTSAENGPAMAGPAGPVPAPMTFTNVFVRSCFNVGCHTDKQKVESIVFINIMYILSPNYENSLMSSEARFPQTRTINLQILSYHHPKFVS